MKLNRTKDLTFIAMLFAVLLLLGMTPLGLIPIGPIKATTMHIPVIIGAILGGPVAGGILGGFFGVISWYKNFTQPTLASVIFLNPIISIVPRILLGLLTGFVFRFFSKRKEKESKALIFGFWGIITAFLIYFIFRTVRTGGNLFVPIFLLVVTIVSFILNVRKGEWGEMPIRFAAAIGSLTNTILVMGLIYFIYAEEYMTALGLGADQALNTVLSVCFINGMPEMIVAVLIATPICKAYLRRN